MKNTRRSIFKLLSGLPLISLLTGKSKSSPSLDFRMDGTTPVSPDFIKRAEEYTRSLNSSPAKPLAWHDEGDYWWACNLKVFSYLIYREKWGWIIRLTTHETDYRNPSSALETSFPSLEEAKFFAEQEWQKSIRSILL